MRLALTGAILLACTGAASAATITGMAEVTKPYTFTLEGQQVYLLGVDSVETGQNCSISGKEWECWAAAQRQLQTILGEGPVTCESVVEATGPDRMIATCTISGTDVGMRLVQSGFAVALPAETTRYDAAQAEARAAGLGLWQAAFTTPSTWRGLPRRPRSNRPEFPFEQPID